MKLTQEELEKEVWKDIIGYEGFYQISDMGRIRSLDRPKSSSNIRRKGKLLSQINNGGYRQVYLRKDFKNRKWFIHILVGIHFIPNPENKKTINHKKGIRHDNRSTELEWNTYSENCQHAYNVLNRQPTHNYGYINIKSKPIFDKAGHYFHGSIMELSDLLKKERKQLSRDIQAGLYSNYQFV